MIRAEIFDSKCDIRLSNLNNISSDTRSFLFLLHKIRLINVPTFAVL